MTAQISRPLRRIGTVAPVIFAALVGAVSVAGCNTPTPAAPGGSGPHISGVQPSVITPSMSPQSVSVEGNDFLPGLTLRVVSPTGAVQALSGAGIEVTSTSALRAQAIFDVPGNYVFVVQNSGGDPSAPFSVAVRDPTAGAPVIASVNPAAVMVGAQPQQVIVSGLNFATGLTTHVTDPDGVVSVVAGNDISSLAPTSFVMSFVFLKEGTYQLQAFSGVGESSNTVTISAVK